MPAPKNKRELQAFLGILNYLGKFSPGMAEICDPLQKLTFSKVVWTRNASYQKLFTKSLIKVDICMKLYNDTKPLYLETDESGVGLGAALLQLHDNMISQKDMVPENTILCPIAFASKSLTRASKDTATSKERHLAYYTAWKSSIIIVLAGRYLS